MTLIVRLCPLISNQGNMKEKVAYSEGTLSGTRAIVVKTKNCFGFSLLEQHHHFIIQAEAHPGQPITLLFLVKIRGLSFHPITSIMVKPVPILFFWPVKQGDIIRFFPTL